VSSNILIARQGLAPLLVLALGAILVMHFIGFAESLIFWGAGAAGAGDFSGS
jgi:type III secretory pathway component EscT